MHHGLEFLKKKKICICPAFCGDGRPFRSGCREQAGKEKRSFVPPSVCLSIHNLTINPYIQPHIQKSAKFLIQLYITSLIQVSIWTLIQLSTQPIIHLSTQSLNQLSTQPSIQLFIEVSIHSFRCPSGHPDTCVSHILCVDYPFTHSHTRSSIQPLV